MTNARTEPTMRADERMPADAIRPEADPVTPRSTEPLTSATPERVEAAPERVEAAPERTPVDRERLTTADLASRDASPAMADGRDAGGTERIARTQAARAEEPAGNGRAALFDGGAAEELRDRWTEIQTGFVDEPRRAVEDADSLVADVMQRLADSFARERQGLERQWSQGDDVSTEELRVALRRYRSFFDRLLSM